MVAKTTAPVIAGMNGYSMSPQRTRTAIVRRKTAAVVQFVCSSGSFSRSCKIGASFPLISNVPAKPLACQLLSRQGYPQPISLNALTTDVFEGYLISFSVLRMFSPYASIFFGLTICTFVKLAISLCFRTTKTGHSVLASIR